MSEELTREERDFLRTVNEELRKLAEATRDGLVSDDEWYEVVTVDRVLALLDALEAAEAIATTVNGQYLEQLARAERAEAALAQAVELLRQMETIHGESYDSLVVTEAYVGEAHEVAEEAWLDRVRAFLADYQETR